MMSRGRCKDACWLLEPITRSERDVIHSSVEARPKIEDIIIEGAGGGGKESPHSLVPIPSAVRKKGEANSQMSHKK
jgi:hypothetical protein